MFRQTSSGLVAGRRPRVWTGFGPFEKPSAPAFSAYAEIRALSSYFSECTRGMLCAG